MAFHLLDTVGLAISKFFSAVLFAISKFRAVCLASNCSNWIWIKVFLRASTLGAGILGGIGINWLGNVSSRSSLHSSSGDSLGVSLHF